MQLKMCRSLWGAPASLDETIAQTLAAGFDGIEGPIPKALSDRKHFASVLRANGLSFIAEVTTGLAEKPTYDWWVPEPHFTIEDHLNDLRQAIEWSADVSPLFISTMCGYDAWSFQQNLDFFGRAIELAEQSDVIVSFETHRCRSLFNPWVTRDVIAHFPTMKLTCDFSHWCVVAERLIDTELPIICACAERAQHVHCRVGYAQRAQVTDPAAPEFTPAVEAHERWWDIIWQNQHRRGMQTVTMTSEFGPDGYTPELPYTRQAVVDLWKITRWMADRQKFRFAGKTWGTL